MFKKELYPVLLPIRILKHENDKTLFKKLVLDYMRRYPHYDVKFIKNGFAVCERNEDRR